VRDGPVPLDSSGLHAVALGDGQLLVKRGGRQLLVSGASGLLLSELLGHLDGATTTEDVVARFPEERRGVARKGLALLVEHRLVLDEPSSTGSQPSLRSFLAQVGLVPEQAEKALAQARVVVAGVNLVSRRLTQGLTESTVGSVELVSDPLLDGHGSPSWTDSARVADTDGGLALSAAGCSLLCATSDAGDSPALLSAGRVALAAGVPFLPAWVSEHVGYVGPLTHPFETACLRCYQLRVESNDPYPDVVLAERQYLKSHPALRDGSGLLPPMAGVVGDIAAMEGVKLIVGMTSRSLAGHQIEINLVTFAARVRRVLKLPRCPDCSDRMWRSAVAQMDGPR